MKQWIVIPILCGLIAISAYAAKSQEPLPINLMLKSLEVVRTQEKSGDEIYLTVTAFYGEHATHIRIPTFPEFWPSRSLNQLHSLSLWQEKLLPQQTVSMVVDLVEHDAPPWLTDDLIGNVELQLKNEKGTLWFTWKQPNIKNTQKKQLVLLKPGQKVEQTFQLKSDGSTEYKMTLELEQTQK